MLPDPQDTPTLGAQQSIHPPVPRRVAVDLGEPESGVGLGTGAVFPAAVVDDGSLALEVIAPQ